MRQGEERRVRYRRGSWKSRLERLERETGEAKGSRNGFLIQHEWEMDKKAISKQCHWSGSAALQRKSVDKKWVGGGGETKDSNGCFRKPIRVCAAHVRSG